jgi:hypothetical protein
METVYSSPQEAAIACQKYVGEVLALQERYGVYEFCEDSSANMFVTAQYRDSNGQIQKYYH